MELKKTALRLFTGASEYHVPVQDLAIDLARIPAILRAGFVISDIRFITSRDKARHFYTAIRTREP